MRRLKHADDPRHTQSATAGGSLLPLRKEPGEEGQGEGERHLTFNHQLFFETRYAGLRGNIRD